MMPIPQQDILLDILSGSYNDRDDDGDKINQLIAECIGAAKPRKPANLVVQTNPGPKVSQQSSRKKTTHYLTNEVFEELDMAKNMMRDLCPEVAKSRISKTAIVNKALKMMLAEFKNNGKNSRIVRKILQNS